MTTILSYDDVTYSDSLHIFKVDAGEESFLRKPKINILNPYTAYSICGVSLFPPVIERAIIDSLENIAASIRETGHCDDAILNPLYGVLNESTHILLIQRESRWIISKDKLSFVPPGADICMGTGASHYNSLRYKQDKIKPEELLGYLAVMDDMSSGPWVRFKHSVLEK